MNKRDQCLRCRRWFTLSPKTSVITKQMDMGQGQWRTIIKGHECPNCSLTKQLRGVK